MGVGDLGEVWALAVVLAVAAMTGNEQAVMVSGGFVGDGGVVCEHSLLLLVWESDRRWSHPGSR